MSGHSKWSTIKRQKEINDNAKGKIFTKLGLAISVAVKTGGSADPEMNPKLRMAIDAARASNMPKDNIERAVNKAKEKGDLEEITYEGFGPNGVGIIVEAATDNRNRTAQEIKNIFEKGGGSMAGPGAVSFGFKQCGYILVEKSGNSEEQTLLLIDSGADDVEESDDSFELYTSIDNLNQVRDFLQSHNQKIISFELVKRANTPMQISDPAVSEKIVNLLNNLEDHNDVQKVFTNALV